MPSTEGQLVAVSSNGSMGWLMVGSADGQLGSFHIDPSTGQWTYTLDDRSQSLREGQSVQEIFTVRATDGTGAYVDQQVTVTITGTNDAPTISGVGTGEVVEDGTQTASGTLISADVDIGDTASWSVGDDHGSYGNLVVDQNGNWTYTLDNDTAQGLKAGETHTDIFQVTATDSAGATATHEVTVTVTGTNDAPVISGTGTGAVTEDQIPTASGKLDVSDADIGDTATWSVGDDHGSYGNLVVDQNGNWTYTLDNDAAQGLKQGETHTDIFQVTATDSAGATATHEVTVTVTGTNDAPVISGSGTGAVTEDQVPTASGKLDVSDADIGDSATWSVGDDHGSYGNLVVDQNGNWTYTLDNDAAQGLKAGETHTDIFQVTATDSAGATATHEVTVTVTGTNDAPVISGTGTGAVTEDQVPTASGKLDVSDADIGDTATWNVGDDHGSYGNLTVDANGNWTYTLDNDAAQGLKAGETRTDIFQVTATDSSGATATHEVTVTVTGTNDAPVISGSGTGAVTEDQVPTASGKLGVSDADIGDTATWSVSDDHGSYGNLAVDQNGNWTYTLDNDAAQGLKAGETRTDIFQVTATDSSGVTATHEVTVTVTGTNDVPVISGTGTGAVTEDQAPTASGKLDVSDADIGDTATWNVGDDHGSYGNLVVDQNGNWTYTLDNNAAQGLKAGETHTDIFQVTATDSAGATATHEVTVTVTGTNDAPAISGSGTGAVTEDQVPTASGKLDVSDADIGDTASWSVGDDHGSYGNLIVDQNGNWTYTLDNEAAQGLKAGETHTDIFQVTATDSAGATATHEVTVTVTGTNDAPVISGTGTGAVTEDQAPTTSGKLDVSDADIGDTATWSVGDDHGSYGNLVVDQNGNWTYTLDNDAAQGLKAGEIRTDIFQVTATDSAGATATHEVTVTVTGTNDAPVISGSGTGAVTEDQVPTASGKLDVSDADIGDTASWSVGDDHGSYGNLVVDQNGNWTYTLDNDAAHGLKQGETHTDIFQVTATDSSGATATHEVSVIVTGTNDAPVISGTATGAVTEDDEPSASGKLISSDADQGDTATWTVVNGGNGSYGSLSVDQDGNWTYTLDDRAQALAAGESHQDVFTVTVTDSAGAVAEQQVMINVAGKNDAPVVDSALAFSVNEDGTITISDTQFLQGASDVDSPTLGIANLVVNGGVGALSGPDGNGYYTYTPPPNFSGDVTLSYDVTDGQASTHQTATVDVIPQADAPELSVSLGAGTEIGGGSGGEGGGNDPDLGIDVSITDPGHYDQTGTDGNDWIRAGEGDNSIKAGAGDDTIYGDMDYQSSGKDYIDAGAGNDTVTGGDDSDQIVGGEGNDTIYVDFQNVSSNPGNDIVDAGAGNDTVFGGDGDDKIAGGSGDDTLYGDFDYQTKGGNDQISGGEGNDLIIGGAGNDIIAGGDGNDTIYGDYRWNTSDDGDDKIAGGKGDDIIYGGGGNDTLMLEGNRNEYQITQNADGSFTIIDMVADRDGTDKVYDIENFSFADGDVPASDILTGGGGSAPHGTEYPLNITAGLTDTDGSETLSNIVIDMSNVPDGTTFSAGSEVDGKWMLTPDQLPGLTMTVPAGSPPFDLNVSVTSTESANGDSKTTDVSIHVDGSGDGSSAISSSSSGASIADAVAAVVVAGTDEASSATTDSVLAATQGGSQTPTDQATDTVAATSTDDAGSATQQPADQTVAEDSASAAAAQSVLSDAQATGGDATGASGSDQAGTAAPAGSAPQADGAAVGSTAGTDQHQIGADGQTGDVQSSDAASADGTTTAAGSEADQTASTAATGTNASTTAAGAQHDTSVGVSTDAGSQSDAAAVPGTTAADGTSADSGAAQSGASGNAAAPADGTTATTGHEADQTTSTVAAGTGSSTGTDASTTAAGTQHDTSTDTSTTVVSQPDTTTPGETSAQGSNGTGAEVDTPIASEPIDAGGNITLVSVNDWYNPSWGGGYNATFQLTLTDDMLKDGGVEGWSLQVGVNDPNAVVSTGWLNGFNGTVSFDPSTGTFTNEGQDYKPELHAGDTIQFTIQVQNTGFNMADLSFSYTDLDPAVQGAAASGTNLGTAQDATAGTSMDTGDTQAAAVAASDSAQAVAQSADAAGSTEATPAAAAPTNTAAHTDTGAASQSDAATSADGTTATAGGEADQTTSTTAAGTDASTTAAGAQHDASAGTSTDATSHADAATSGTTAHGSASADSDAGHSGAGHSGTGSDIAAPADSSTTATTSSDTSQTVETAAAETATSAVAAGSTEHDTSSAAVSTDATSHADVAAASGTSTQGSVLADSGAGQSVAVGEAALPITSEPIDAGGHITLVNVNDWYNPSWGGGYNATFQLTLTDDMLKGGAVEGWSLQVGLDNPNAVVSTGWLDGFNGTVSFDPSTGTFTNDGQDYKPELHAGDTIQFTIQVQNTGFNMADLSFSYKDLDPALHTTTDSGSGLGAAHDGSASPQADTGDAHAASVAASVSADAAVGDHAVQAHSHPADIAHSADTVGGAGSHTSAAGPIDTTAHAHADDNAVAGASDSDKNVAHGVDQDQAHGLDQNQPLSSEHAAPGSSESDHATAGHAIETPVTGGHDFDHGLAGTDIADHHGASDAANHDHAGLASSSSTAGAYLELVEPPHIDDHAPLQPVDHQSSGNADYAHMAAGAEHAMQEPPPPDHLFADAQIDHASTSPAGQSDAQHQTADHDAAAAATPPEPMAMEHDQGHHGN